jgi:beta-N-acetylhexosaminidase
LLSLFVTALFALPLLFSHTSAGATDQTLETSLASLSVADKVGQLLLLGSDGLSAAGATTAIRELRTGAIVLGNGRDADQTRATVAELQAMARAAGLPPLLIAIDQEGEPVQRIRSGVTSFGPNWLVGQLPPGSAREAACVRGVTQGRELTELGIHLNLAPVLDVWDNPRNTVIAHRSYSDDPAVVSRLGAAYIEALQSQGMLATAKHFPGHGSSVEDSHRVLPVVNHDRERLSTVELAPFRAAIRAGVAAIMTAHVSYPLIDQVAARPGSLSPPIVSGILRDELRYDGLVVTDDIGAMRAVVDNYEPGEAAIQAILAGSDVISVVGPLSSQRLIVEALTAAVGPTISMERLDASVRRVLRAKQQAGLLGTVPARSSTGLPCGYLFAGS